MYQVADFAVCPGCGDPISVDLARAADGLAAATTCDCGGHAEAPPEFMEAARILALAAALPGGEELVAPEAAGLAAAAWQALLGVYEEFSGSDIGDGFDSARHELAARVCRMVDLG